MFERYTVQARRVVFFARYEAASLASQYITPEHLLLGLVREARQMLEAHMSSLESLDEMRRDIETRSAPIKAALKVSMSVDLPLDRAAQSVLNWAAEQADALKDASIRPEHLLLALLRNENNPAAVLLGAHGVHYESVRKQIAEGNAPAKAVAVRAPSLAAPISRLRTLLASASRELPDILEFAAATEPRPGGWNRKQILGHLIDSAANNHQRFVRALIQDGSTGLTTSRSPGSKCRIMKMPIGGGSSSSGPCTTRILFGFFNAFRRRRSTRRSVSGMVRR